MFVIWNDMCNCERLRIARHKQHYFVYCPHNTHSAGFQWLVVECWVSLFSWIHSSLAVASLYVLLYLIFTPSRKVCLRCIVGNAQWSRHAIFMYNYIIITVSPYSRYYHATLHLSLIIRVCYLFVYTIIGTDYICIFKYITYNYNNKIKVKAICIKVC